MSLLLSMKAMIWPKGKNTKFLSFRSAGCARESGIHEHRTTSILQIRVFIVSGPPPEVCPEMTPLVTGEFLPSLKADPALAGRAKRSCVDRRANPLRQEARWIEA